MSKVLVDNADLSGIANAIRQKTGGSTTYKPSEMAQAVRDIPTGITPTGTKNITENGTHDVTQYESAAVNVPNSYSASDEGKVVSNGALVAQTSRTVTKNGTYDTTLNDEVVVSVSGGGSGSVLSGTNKPLDSVGSDGDIFVEYHDDSANFTKLDFIANNTAFSKYINTGYNLKQNSIVEISFFVRSTGSSSPANNGAYVLGCRPSSGKYAGGIELYCGNLSGYPAQISNGTNVYDVSDFSWMDKRIYVRFGLTEIEACDEYGNKRIINTVQRSQNSEYPLYLFAITGYLTSTNPIGRIDLFRITENGHLVMNLRPALDGNNTACMYDTVSGTFFYSASGNAFNAGDQVTDDCVENIWLKTNGKWMPIVGADVDEISGISR